MRAIFHAPIANPDARAASGVQRMGVLVRCALEAAGVEVQTPALPRSYDGRGDAEVQRAQRAEGEQAVETFLASVRGGVNAKPDFWFSYHVYYKSPDWIGPGVCRALKIPYVIAEGSHAPKRAGGPWALGHEGATLALQAADRLLAMTRFDRVCLDQLAAGRVRDLKPFIDARAFAQHAAHARSGPMHVLSVAMMRNERKRASYGLLAAALKLLPDVALTLSIAGDGEHRREIEDMFSHRAALHDIRFLGAVAAERVAELMTAADIFAWPGLGEAYGLVFLEAQAAGLPVVACSDRGVPDVTRAGETALLSAPGDAAAYAAHLRRLASDEELRRRLGENARRFVLTERSVEAAGANLRGVLAELGLR